MQQFGVYQDLMTLPEVTEALRVSASVVEELIKQHVITYVTIRETKLVRKFDFINYVKKQ